MSGNPELVRALKEMRVAVTALQGSITEALRIATLEDPGSALAVSEPPTSQALVSEFVDTARSLQIEPPRRFIGQMAQAIKALLDEGMEPEVVRAGMARMIERRIMNPSLLPQFVMEASIPKAPARVFGYGITPSEILRAADQLEQEGQ